MFYAFYMWGGEGKTLKLRVVHILFFEKKKFFEKEKFSKTKNSKFLV